mgnify:CR=1 FL=1
MSLLLLFNQGAAPPEHPVGRITQAFAFGAHSGRRYGSFAGKTTATATHPVDRITQAQAFGAHSGRRYGSFAGKATAVGSHPVGRLTQAFAFGAHSGRRYGSFAGRAEAETPVEESGGGWQPVHAYYHRRRLEELRQVKAKLQELEVVAQETFAPQISEQTSQRKTIRSLRRLRELDAERLRLQMHIALLEERFSEADARRMSDEDDATALILMAAVAH